ncbi:cytochrome c oxidase subunit IV [Trichocladium antarcticum]|uniref:Cytochrome c oxidase polypeptide V n=1 Tax=Trichocladium antarcticum TaxID=1450529 RepID=A0AAN6UJW1_9PEZI|nr:cytochrome c oxidase subunit IV [Trichocladium antarcticum]
MSAIIRNSLVRAARPSATAALGYRAASTHAISNPTLANIEKRWEGLPMQEQAELWMALRDRMKENWTEMTIQEKKAAYWIAFGPHGPRSLPPPGETQKVVLYTVIGLVASFVIFASMRMFAKPPPATMTKEWQEATDEFLKVSTLSRRRRPPLLSVVANPHPPLQAQKSDPLTGISSESRAGSHVQSPSSKA